MGGCQPLGIEIVRGDLSEAAWIFLDPERGSARVLSAALGMVQSISWRSPVRAGETRRTLVRNDGALPELAASRAIVLDSLISVVAGATRDSVLNRTGATLSIGSHRCKNSPGSSAGASTPMSVDLNTNYSDSESLGTTCAVQPRIVAHVQLGELVVRRLTLCGSCLENELRIRREAQPASLRGIWPIDFVELRANLDVWRSGRSTGEVQRTARRISLVMKWFEQEWPPDFDRERGILDG